MLYSIIIIAILLLSILIITQKSSKLNNRLLEEIEVHKKEINNKESQIKEYLNDIKTVKAKLEKYSGIKSINKEIEEKNSVFEKLNIEAIELNEKYIRAKKILRDLEDEVKLYENDLELINIGIYKPIYDFDTSEKYKEELNQLYESQKQLINDNNACICNTTWHINNSYKKGEIMIRKLTNLSLRAFNGECDNLISKVKWNNIQTFEERIKKIYSAINKLGTVNEIHITEDYLKLKLNELHIAHEYQLKKYEEKEEVRRIREIEREEETVQREIEKARKDAEQEEMRFQKAIEIAKKQLGLVSGEELDKLKSKIEELEENLKQTQEVKERAISRAQETKSGHVYIISNIGSFGENIYKIGMTRRLEPMDRVNELGDASVPFRFDVHAMIFSQNAPELENLLQKEFAERRINKINNRKEFFNVTLGEIEQTIKNKYQKEVEFVKTVEAKEYRETQKITEQLDMNKVFEEKTIDKYPEKLF